jgi:hypothetical protein
MPSGERLGLGTHMAERRYSVTKSYIFVTFVLDHEEEELWSFTRADMNKVYVLL